MTDEVDEALEGEFHQIRFRPVIDSSIKHIGQYELDLEQAKNELICIEREYNSVKERYEHAKRVVDALHMIVNPKAMRLRGGE